MPVYTYRCEHCGHQFDKQQHFSEEPLKACPVCRKRQLRKVYSPAGVVFKGSGFYVTDTRKASPGKANGKEASKDSANKPAEGKPESAKSEKAEAKPAAPSEKKS